MFVFAASALSPTILLGVWWRRLTARGAVAGMVVGSALRSAALLVTSVLGPGDGLARSLLAQPAAWTIPLATA
ncbi:cation acetate symporter, partial [Actinotalea fermentans ATCC 43279 = JCM 9966 = DSM 3133]